jgi:hypothetical protein
MEFGVGIFFTDYSISPAELAVALEERGFDSLWAPEHSHIPVPRRTPTPDGGELPKRYYEVMDPFVTLTTAAAVTKRLKLGTGVCLVIQRDTIQTAKLVASTDQVSNGRFLFGIGGGWNAEEIENHGTVFATRFKKARSKKPSRDREQNEAEYTRNYYSADDDLAEAGRTAGHCRRARGGAPGVRYGDGWIPIAGGSRWRYPRYLPRFRQRPRGRRDPVSAGVGPGSPDPAKARASRCSVGG